MMNRFLFRCCVVSSLLAPGIWNATSASAAPKKAPAKKGKPSGKVRVLAAKGVLMEGKGDINLSAAFANRGANLLSSSFEAVLDDEQGTRLNAGIASKKDGSTGILAIMIPSKRVRRGNIEIKQTISLIFASKGGFRSGQAIPITLPDTSLNPPKTATALINYTQFEFKEENRGGGLSPRIRERPSTWEATSGTLKIESVSPSRLTFSLSNVVFRTPESEIVGNSSRGSFTMKGTGELKLTDIPDGFR